jgi:hypothetical protein
MLVRFYYFAFLYHYRQKGEDSASWSGSLMVVVITLFFITGIFYSFLQHFFFLPLTLNTLRFYAFGYCAVLFLALYQSLVRNGKSEKIYIEFISHPWNTKKNRIVCFVIFFASMLLMMGCVVVLKGYIKLS